MPPGVEKFGITAEEIRTDVESQFKKIGVSIVGAPILSDFTFFTIAFHVAQPREPSLSGLFIYNLHVFLGQPVIVKNNKESTLAITWQKNLASYGGQRRMESIRTEIRNIMDMFANEYLSVNPKENK